MKRAIWPGTGRSSKLLLAVLASLLAGPATAEIRSVGIIVAREPGLAASATRGLALKLAVEAQRRGIQQVAQLGAGASALPAEDDPFFGSCFSDDDCLLRLAATAGQAVLLVVVEGAPSHRRARLAFVHERLQVLVRRARVLAEPFEHAIEQEAIATLEAGLARLPVVATASTQPSDLEAARRKTLRLWKIKCAVCHGPDGKGQTVMGLRLGLADLGDKESQKRMDDGKVKGWLLEGKHSNDGAEPEMASLGKRLTVEQIDSLLGVVRSFGN